MSSPTLFTETSFSISASLIFLMPSPPIEGFAFLPVIILGAIKKTTLSTTVSFIAEAANGVPLTLIFIV